MIPDEFHFDDDNGIHFAVKKEGKHQIVIKLYRWYDRPHKWMFVRVVKTESLNDGPTELERLYQKSIANGNTETSYRQTL